MTRLLIEALRLALEKAEEPFHGTYRLGELATQLRASSVS